MPPRTANSPTSRTVGTRSKPEVSSREISSFMLTLLPGFARERLRLDHLGRRDALEQRVGGGQDDGAVRRLAQRDHRRQRVEPARGGIRAGRDAVVGQAVPGREFEHRQVRGDEGERLDDRGQALAVAGDEEQRTVGRGLGCRRGEREGFKTVGDAVDDELAGPAFRQADCFRAGS